MDHTVVVRSLHRSEIYSWDPSWQRLQGASDGVQNPHAKLHKELGYREVISSDLQVMDETAITLCKENDIPVRPNPTAMLLLLRQRHDAHDLRPMKFQRNRSVEVLRYLSEKSGTAKRYISSPATQG